MPTEKLAAELGADLTRKLVCGVIVTVKDEPWKSFTVQTFPAIAVIIPLTWSCFAACVFDVGPLPGEALEAGAVAVVGCDDEPESETARAIPAPAMEAKTAAPAIDGRMCR